MNKAAFKYFAILTFGLISSCQHLAEVGPIDLDKKDDRRKTPRDYKIVNITNENLSKYNSTSEHKSHLPPSDLTLTYTDKITSGDKLQLFVMDNRQAGMVDGAITIGPFDVDSEGYTTIPHLGRLQVSSLAISDLEQKVAEKYSTISNTVQVSLSRISRKDKTANIIGLVGKPGQQEIDRSGITFADLVAKAGGPKIEPYLCDYTLYRNGKKYQLSHQNVFKNRIMIQNNDVLEVSKSPDRFVTVIGTSGRQRNLPFPSPHSHLTDILAEAGGLNRASSNASGVFVFRLNKSGTKHIVYKFNLKEANTLFAARKFHTKGRDIVYITEAPLSRWNRAIKDILSLGDISRISNATRIAN